MSRRSPPRRGPMFSAGPGDYEAVWSTFTGASSTLRGTPGAREEWRRGRARYAVWVFRVECAEVLARLAQARAALAPWIDPMPDREAHITVAVAGFPAARPALDDDIDERALERAVAGLRDDPPAAPALEVGGLTSFLSCPVLEVHDPGGGLGALRERLSQHHREIRFTPYLPHITAGLYSGAPTAPIAVAIAPLRALPRLPLRPTALELVEFDASVQGAPLLTRSIADLSVI
jgi:hypothetical protein